MKKTLLLLLLSMFALFANAQNNTVNKGAQTPLTEKQLLNSVQSCTELNKQLTEKFGKNFSISDEKVLAQLSKNVAEGNRSGCLVKLSTYVLNNVSQNNTKEKR